VTVKIPLFCATFQNRKMIKCKNPEGIRTTMNILYKIFALVYSALMHRLEKKIGYRLTFTAIPETWINGWMIFDMEKSWAKHGMKAQGVNYFTVGALVDGTSSRFLRNEKQYQSWLGAYLAKFRQSKDFTLQDHFDLAVADQKNWLGDFGDPHPYYEMPETNAYDPEPINISGYSGKLYWFSGGSSHTDVGSKSKNFRNRILMALMASMFNNSNPMLKLKSRNFLPQIIETEYEKVLLKGFVAIIELAKDTKIVFYGNGTSLLDKDGKETKDYTSILKQDILTAFRSAKIEKI